MRKANFKNIQILSNNDIYKAESIERMVERAETTETPIDETAPIIYTERKDGVLPQYDIRSDRWELAQAAMDKVAASYRARRDEYIKKISGKEDTTKGSAEVSA